MNIEEFYNIIDKIENCLNYYENKDYDATKYDIDFANGDHVSLKFNSKNIPHLLGINIDVLRSTGMYKEYAYQTLWDIVNNPMKLYDLINKGYISYNQVFSDYINEKLDNFKSICGMRIFDLEFVVNYKKDRNLKSNEPLYDGYYFGYLKDAKLSVVGFTLNENNNTYYPTTNLSFEQYSEEYNKFLRRLFTNQTTTIVETMRKNTLVDFGHVEKQTYYYQNHDKVSFLRNCRRYAETYGASSNTISSNIFYVEKVMNLNEEKGIIAEIVNTIAEKITNNKMIDVRQLQNKFDYPINNFILNLISAYNDSLVIKRNNDKDDNNDNDNLEYSYKEIIEDYNNCKKELERIESLKNKLEGQNKKLQEQLSSLKNENSTLQDEREQIKKILIKK